ncbi:MAG TPA: glycoside hydrolase family 3 N-terminal domain-containing protein [Thermoanaerobaculia bacterium]|nr:glycoside hydrolase family 3 N-terminal domain-containing protein [Thermoanaerobaculia bacterium]
MSSRLFGVGIAGATLLPEERDILERDPPRAVILFRRNVESAGQIRDLTEEIHRLPGSPLLCLDQEGGPVDRLRDILSPSISFRDAARLGVARLAGELQGEACALLGFDVDLAPVLDRLLPGASERVLKDRCASADPDEIASAAADFLRGLAARGVGGCVKHFPGLGRADLDTHKDLPVIPNDPAEEQRDLAPFRATMEEAGAVMVSHAATTQGRPASLSPEIATDLLRRTLGFTGAVFSDDLEMGALSAFGDLPERCAQACLAGCDLLFVCSRIGVYSDCVAAVEQEVPRERREQAAARLDSYGHHLRDLRSAAKFAERPLSALVADITDLKSRASNAG